MQITHGYSDPWTTWFFPYQWEKTEPSPSFRNSFRLRSTCANYMEDESRKHHAVSRQIEGDKLEMDSLPTFSALFAISPVRKVTLLQRRRVRKWQRKIRNTPSKIFPPVWWNPTPPAFLTLLVTETLGVRIKVLSNVFSLHQSECSYLSGWSQGRSEDEHFTGDNLTPTFMSWFPVPLPL